MSEAAPEAPAAPIETPAAPVDAAPAAPPAPVEPATPAEAPAAPEAPAEAKDGDLPQWARDAISKANAEAAKYRTSAKTAAEEAKAALAQEIGKALGLIKADEPADPSKLTEQLTATQAEAQSARLELAIHRAAAAKKLDADTLLDSRAFMTRAQQIDPTDGAALDALVAEVTTGNTRYRATQAAPAGGADLGPGGQTAPRIYTKAQLADHDFYMQNRADIRLAYTQGRIRE